MTFFLNTNDDYLDRFSSNENYSQHVVALRVHKKNSRMKRRRRQLGQVCFLIVGILLTTTGICIFAFLDPIYDFILSSALQFTPGSQSYKAWQTNDPPLIMDIYLFNWTNPEQITNHSVKPNFQEVGPYRLKEVKEKVNVSLDEENYIVNYSHRKLYYFDKEDSVQNLSDVINVINAVPLTIGFKVKHANWLTQKVVSATLSSVSSLHVKKNVSQLLFDGYEETIIGVLSKLPLSNIQDKFGIFYGKNDTRGKDGVFSMNYKTDENFGRILTWNHKNYTNFYEGHCNDIKGSAGEFYPFNRQRDKIILYSGELCKYAELEYVEDVNIKGVKGYKYTADYIFDNGTERPENACFCVGECIPSGVFNVSTCRDSPSFLSFPHFYRADPYYTNSMEGMKPDKAKHEFYIILEPKSGVVMELQAVMQVNLLMQPIKNIRLYQNVPKIYVPLFYFTQNIYLHDDIASSLRLIQNVPDYCNYLVYITLSLGIVFILLVLGSYFWHQNEKQTLHGNGTSKSQETHDNIPLRYKN